MSWTKLSDDFTDRADLAGLDPADRWHYLAMIQLCSRGEHLTGELRAVDARRASDHEDPAAAVQRIAAAGLLEVTGTTVRVVEIDEHIPPPSVRMKADADKRRKRRERAHKAGDHHLCLSDHCTSAAPLSSRPEPRDVTRDPGTGRDGTGRAFARADIQTEQANKNAVEITGWATATPGQAATVNFPPPPYTGTEEAA